MAKKTPPYRKLQNTLYIKLLSKSALGVFGFGLPSSQVIREFGGLTYQRSEIFSLQRSLFLVWLKL